MLSPQIRRRSLGEFFFNPTNIADHSRENNSRDFCVNPRNLRERKVFLHKSAHLRKKIFLIPPIAQIHAKLIHCKSSAQISEICGRNEFFLSKSVVDHWEKFFLIPLIAQITAEKITPGISA
jgi:hypothetical protein